MNKRELIKRSLDTENAFISSDAEATAVNPEIWDRQLMEYQEKNLVVAPQAEQFDFRNAGSDYTVTIDEAPSAASELTETTDISISSFATRQKTFTPSEYGAAYQLTRKEAVRAFFNVAERMTRKLGYKLAVKKDNIAVDTIYNGAGNTILANGKTATSDLTDTDTLNYELITKGIKNIETDVYTPTKLIISYTQKQQLLNLGTINKANEFGTRDAIQRGLVGELFGLQIIASHSIVPESSVAKAIMLGETQTGEQAFGMATKRDPIIEREYHARGRYWDIVAHEEYDFKVLHSDAIELLATYG